MEYDPMEPEFCAICGGEMVPYTVGRAKHNHIVYYFSYTDTKPEDLPEDAEAIECLICTICTSISIDGQEGGIENVSGYRAQDQHDEDDKDDTTEDRLEE